VRWNWPFKSRNGTGSGRGARNGHGQNGVTGEACPDFLCVGAQKAGTSWLFHQLTLHPDFWMPPIKELYYFDTLSRVKRYNPPRCKDERDEWFLARLMELSALPDIELEAYSQLFAPKAALLSGDISPSYSALNDEVIEQVVNYFPNLKVIFLARDPVERAWSHLCMQVRLGLISRFDATDAEQVIRNLRNPGMLARSHPSKIVARWKRYVRPDLFRFYFFDDLQQSPAELRRLILCFLGADPDKPSGRISADYNGQGEREKLPLTDKVRCRLAEFFEQELKACATELGGPAKAWPARYGFSVAEFREHSKSFGPIDLRYEPNRTIESK
jgi:hypothetical protein